MCVHARMHARMYVCMYVGMYVCDRLALTPSKSRLEPQHKFRRPGLKTVETYKIKAGIEDLRLQGFRAIFPSYFARTRPALQGVLVELLKTAMVSGLLRLRVLASEDLV